MIDWLIDWDAHKRWKFYLRMAQGGVAYHWWMTLAVTNLYIKFEVSSAEDSPHMANFVGKVANVIV